MDATTHIAPKIEGSRVAAAGLDPRDRVHFLDAYGDDKALCGTVVGATWHRMSEWTRVPGGSTPCSRCLKAERKVAEAQAHMARVAHEPVARLTVSLRRVEAGLYETRDGRYGVVLVESVGEWDDVSDDGWAITQERREGAGEAAKDGNELPGYYRTKAEAVEALAEMLA